MGYISECYTPTMMINDTIETIRGRFDVEYQACDNFDQLPYHFSRAAGLCVYQDQLVMCRARDNKVHFPGGRVEAGETLEQALIREVREESSMKVLYHQPLGFQKLTNATDQPIYQAFFYAEVEPYGSFSADPDKHIIGVFYQDLADFMARQVAGTREQAIANSLVKIHQSRQIKQ